MIRMFCDRCGTELNKDDYRSISIGDKHGEITCVCEVPKDNGTMLLSSEICVKCAREIISEFKMKG